MISDLPIPQRDLILAVSAPLIYIAMVAIGRTLKRRSGAQLGIAYQLFAICLALYVPLKVLNLDLSFAPFDLRREIGAAAMLLGALCVVSLMRPYVWENYFARNKQTEIPKFLQDIAGLVIFLVAVLLVLSIGYEQKVPGLVAGSGIVAVILGFAMQDLLGNIISGIALHIGQPFKPGDWLMFENHHAEVIEVNWRSTRLRTNDDVCLDIPNNQIVRHTILNLSYPTRCHAMRITVGVDYSVPPNRVKKVIAEAAATAFGVVAHPAPKVFLKDFGDSAIIYELKFSMERDDLFNDIFDSIKTNIWYGLNRAEMKIPFPIRTLKIDRAAQAANEISAVARAGLRGQSIFQCLSDAQMEQLLDSARLLRYGAGEKIIQQNAQGDSMFVLLHGSAGVHVGADGAQTLVATLGAGAPVGEMSLLTGEKRSATVIAQTDCDVLEIRKSVFAELLENNEMLLQKLSELLAQRRMENEGALASASEKKTLDARKEEYTKTFFTKLRSFFEL